MVGLEHQLKAKGLAFASQGLMNAFVFFHKKTGQEMKS